MKHSAYLAKPFTLRSFNLELDDRELDRLITLKILDGIAWDFTKAK